METPGTKACLQLCCPWRALLRNLGTSNKARTVRRLLQLPPQPGAWLQGPLWTEGHCGCPDFSFLSHEEPADKIVKVLVLLPNLRRILNLGDKKSSESQALLAGKNFPVPLGNEEELWKRPLTFQGPFLPSAFSFSIPSWSGTAWSIVLEVINESNLFSASLKDWGIILVLKWVEILGSLTQNYSQSAF